MMGFLAMATMASGTTSMVGNGSTTASNNSDPIVTPGMDDQLGALMPGLLGSPLLGVVLRYLHIDPRALISILGFLSAIMFAWQYLEQYVFNQLGWLLCTVNLRPDDEIYVVMSSWIASQPFSQRSRSFIVNSSSYNSRRLWDPYWWWDRDEDGEEVQQRRQLTYTPAPGTHFFWYKKRLLILRRQCNREGSGYLNSSEREEISISSFGRDPYILKNLLNEAYSEYNERDQDNKTLIYRGVMKQSWGQPTWQRSLARATRPFSTVILDEKVKQDLIDDMSDYLDPTTRRWYSNRGIPYRRGYLFYGPPGTGKSSLSLALAGHFQMRIYIVSLSSIVADEENLSSLFGDLPRRCLVLLEDIDSAGLTHTREKDSDDVDVSDDGDDDKQARGSKRNARDSKGGRLSLSGLLNILDGVASSEGRIVVMTTNHAEKLDKALIRPGRVDMQIKFELADKNSSKSIFKSMFGQFEDELTVNGKHSHDLSDEGSEAEKTKDTKAEMEREAARIEALATKFSNNVIENKFSPAEIQGFLLKHKRTPEKAVEGVAEWCEQILKEREQEEKKKAEEKKKKEEKRLLKKAKKKEKEEKKLKELKRRVSNLHSSASEESGSEEESNSDPGSDQDEPKKKKKRTQKSKRSRRRNDDSDSDQVDSASSAEDEKKENKRRRKRRQIKKEKNQTKKHDDSNTETSGSDSEEECRKKKSASKRKPKNETEKSGGNNSGEVQSSDPTVEVVVEKMEEDSKDVTSSSPIDSKSQENSHLSPSKNTKCGADSGYGTP